MAAHQDRPVGFPVRSEPIVHWQDSERVAAEWMRVLGYPTAKVSRGGPDLGVDVRAPRLAIAQVKYMQPVIGRELIQLLVGARHPDCLEAMMFFSRSRYHNNALQWAGIWNVALFRFDDCGNPYPENKAAKKMCLDVGYDRWREMPAPVDRVLYREDAALRREPILTTAGTPVTRERSAGVAIRTWAKKCGFVDAMDSGDGMVTAKGLAILVGFGGTRVAVDQIQRLADKPGDRVRAVVSWAGYSKNARKMAQEYSIALFGCTPSGVLECVNQFAASLLDEVSPPLRSGSRDR